MTNPNWWDVEPFCEEEFVRTDGYDGWLKQYNIPLIIAEVQKRGETTAKRIEGINDLFECSNCELPSLLYEAKYCCDCGAKIAWE